MLRKKLLLSVVVLILVSGVVTAGERREREFSFNEKNAHCVDPQDYVRDVYADLGWKIDTTSIKTIHTHVSTKSHYSGITSRSEDRFRIEFHVRNNGTCGPKVFGKPAWRDGRGVVLGTVRYFEYK